jgi:hypothetical protein
VCFPFYISSRANLLATNSRIYHGTIHVWGERENQRPRLPDRDYRAIFRMDGRKLSCGSKREFAKKDESPVDIEYPEKLRKETKVFFKSKIV